jgi:hypothetical protein
MAVRMTQWCDHFQAGPEALRRSGSVFAGDSGRLIRMFAGPHIRLGVGLGAKESGCSQGLTSGLEWSRVRGDPDGRKASHPA